MVLRHQGHVGSIGRVDQSGFDEKIMGAPQDYNRKEILHRIGTFFLLLGIGLFVLFMLSEAAKQVIFSYFCWGILLIILGFLFRGQFKKTTTPSGRFGLVRRLMPKAKKDQEKKK